ncbi:MULTISPECIES: deoxynucleoside kinase [Bacillus]|uniref:Deoxyguanosine kinase n=2 Tax=Bacillus TaxID=1386 RepID=A0A0M4FM02_9BACI|nr:MULTISPECIES: deoxynucleoside kinase [Bacillus]ALC83229.1 deoxyguanosine kinase [Bacillus gobiensis]MBP1084232.1 deoxyguanosine kinase [Bacillus capparidis]MED1094656.1 deoxynucleoside kinase [Bacillus capparidis]
MKQTPFVAVEGPIGAGKTTLAAMLSKDLNFQLVKEIVEENPFLEKFYENIDEWSFQLEMFFLCHRYKQLEDIERHYMMQQKPVIADYHNYKNLIFADLTLSEKNLEKYRQIFKILSADLPKPGVIIYIKASLPTLLLRIKKRGRSFEQEMDSEYLAQLIKKYETAMDQLIKADPSLNIITIDGDKEDFVQSKDAYERIVKQVKEIVHL